MFGTKKARFLEVVVGAFDGMTEGMRHGARSETGLDALDRWVLPTARRWPIFHRCCCNSRASP
jgi:hypothetical protein